MAKPRKGDRFACVPCGREVVVDSCGASETVIWCCGRPMKKGKAASAKSHLKKK